MEGVTTDNYIDMFSFAVSQVSDAEFQNVFEPYNYWGNGNSYSIFTKEIQM